ncbi:hypothetical protein DSO57_1028153 [Entomophthora muscae]|uniref:Uncharacterized protein n=1 Tax=Entomophthora muscae TaxID=34485 RepID=A0ACC2T1L4_9FUNG|nr:hypothetical protein DSO57_1028153 [Entomophthora muscae]
MDMVPTPTPKPMSASAANLTLDKINKLLRIVFIALLGVIDTISLANGPWSWFGRSITHSMVGFARLACSIPDFDEPDTQGWFPDIKWEKIASQKRFICATVKQKFNNFMKKENVV